MSFVTANYGYWEFWAPYAPREGFYGEHSCIFDGENKSIFINPAISSISVKEDIYSDWKEWIQVRDNSKFPPAIRTTGGDAIGTTGEFTGDVYFLINGWRIIISHSLNIDGVIYSDNFDSPFVQTAGTQIVTNKVSSLVSVIAPQVQVSGITIPTAVEIRQEIDANSLKLSAIDNRVTALPLASAIRSEIDTNSSQLQNILIDTVSIKGFTDTLETVIGQIKVTVDAITAAPSAIDIRTEIDSNSTKFATMISELTTLKGYTDTLEASATELKGYTDTLETAVDTLQTTVNSIPTAEEIANQVRTELTPELAHVMALSSNPGLTPTQATMLLSMYELLGLDPSKPLLVTSTSRSAGAISQTIISDANSTIVQRI